MDYLYAPAVVNCEVGSTRVRTACTDGECEASKTGLFCTLLNFVLHARFMFALKDPVVTPMHAISPQLVKHDDLFVVPVLEYHTRIMCRVTCFITVIPGSFEDKIHG